MGPNVRVGFFSPTCVMFLLKFIAGEVTFCLVFPVPDYRTEMMTAVNESRRNVQH